MKKIYLFLIAILIAFTSCDDKETIKNPAQKHDLSEYCGFEVRSKMSDGSNRSTHYYLSLHSKDTTIYNVSVSKKVYNQYGLGDTIECENENDINSLSISNTQPTDGGYKIVTIGGENYLVIKLENNIRINDTTLLK